MAVPSVNFIYLRKCTRVYHIIMELTHCSPVKMIRLEIPNTVSIKLLCSSYLNGNVFSLKRLPLLIERTKLIGVSDKKKNNNHIDLDSLSHSNLHHIINRVKEGVKGDLLHSSMPTVQLGPV